MNLNFGKLDENKNLIYAPDKISTPYGEVVPTENLYRYYGWKKIIKNTSEVLGWYETADLIYSIGYNKSYATLVDKYTINYAPDVLEIDGVIVEPTEQQYNNFGYKQLIDLAGVDFIEYIELSNKIYTIRYNKSYAKLIENELSYSPNILIDGESVNLVPTKDQYLIEGFKEVIDNGPGPEREGYEWKFVGYEETEDQIIYKYEEELIPVPPRVFSKMNLEVAIFNSKIPGLLSKIDEFIDSKEIENEFGDKLPLRRLYDKALTFSEDHPLFKNYLAELKESIPELTDEVIESILSNSIAH